MMSLKLKAELVQLGHYMENEKFNYTINIDPEDLINIHVKQWVLEWCKKYHPEAFDEAEKFVRKMIDEKS